MDTPVHLAGIDFGFPPSQSTWTSDACSLSDLCLADAILHSHSEKRQESSVEALREPKRQRGKGGRRTRRPRFELQRNASGLSASESSFPGERRLGLGQGQAMEEVRRRCLGSRQGSIRRKAKYVTFSLETTTTTTTTTATAADPMAFMSTVDGSFGDAAACHTISSKTLELRRMRLGSRQGSLRLKAKFVSFEPESSTSGGSSEEASWGRPNSCSAVTEQRRQALLGSRQGSVSLKAKSVRFTPEDGAQDRHPTGTQLVEQQRVLRLGSRQGSISLKKKVVSFAAEGGAREDNSTAAEITSPEYESGTAEMRRIYLGSRQGSLALKGKVVTFAPEGALGLAMAGYGTADMGALRQSVLGSRQGSIPRNTSPPVRNESLANDLMGDDWRGPRPRGLHEDELDCCQIVQNLCLGLHDAETVD